jgi:hypothetical protein
VRERQGGQGGKVDKEERNRRLRSKVLTIKDDCGNKPCKDIPLPQSKSAIIK